MKATEITKEGVILTLKNIGVFVGSYAAADIKADLSSFLFAFLIYALISVPSDLYLLNKVHEKAKQE